MTQSIAQSFDPSVAVAPIGNFAGVPLQLIGRDAELVVLRALVEQGVTRGAAAVIVGEPGIGKSALLGEVRRESRSRGFRVLGATGVESEAQLPFAGLHQLLRPVINQIESIVAAQRAALLTAFGLIDGPPPELFMVALAAVNLLALVAEESPVALLVDDVQWLDPQTHEAIAFIARRAVSNHLLVIAAIRDGYESPFATMDVTRIDVG